MTERSTQTKAPEGDLFWEEDNTEDCYTSVKELVDCVASETIADTLIIEIERAKRLPKLFAAVIISGEDRDQHRITYHSTEEAAQAALESNNG